MKSLDDRYTATHGSTHETFADLIFCALVVLLLFVITLAVEVSLRVRKEASAAKPQEIALDEIPSMTKEEIQKLVVELRQKEAELAAYNEQLEADMERVVEVEESLATQVSKMRGEQRFTGAREPAGINIAFSPADRRYTFIPSKEINHANRRLLHESDAQFNARKLREWTVIAAQARNDRSYTLDETRQIIEAFSKYQQIVPTGNSYRIEQEKLGIYSTPYVCVLIARGRALSGMRIPANDYNILMQGLRNAATVSPRDSDSMYPVCNVAVDTQRRTLNIGGVNVSTAEMVDILLALEGRGAILEFTGFDGPPPDWLREQVLIPTGYIAQTPSIPK